jgi:hypothetical protein
VHVTLSQLRGVPEAPEAEAAWTAARASEPGWLSGPDAEAALCDATIEPVVTGTVDPVALDRLTAAVRTGCATSATAAAVPAGLPGGFRRSETAARFRRAVLGLAADALSGPAGLAAWLRQTHLSGGPGSGPSRPLAIALPLDSGTAGPVVPGHLRRAALARHPYCAFPGCAQPGSVCQIHHLIPRSQGGPTVLHNILPLCAFHHLTVIHRWGWQLALNPDGTTTATSPDRQKVLHSHGPPAAA